MGLHDSVLLKDVDSLTFRTNHFTTGRRNSPIAQINCVGGDAVHLKELHPTTVQCQNRGSDGSDIQWECHAELDNVVKFGTIGVVCEGFDSPNDPRILTGSCGLEYGLEYTRPGHHTQTNNNPEYNRSYTVVTFVGLIVILVALTSCGNSHRYDDYGYRSQGNGGWGSFGTGAAMGYTMGRTYCPSYRSSWGGSGRSYGGGSSFSSGSRSTRGYGGTRRR